MRGKRVDRAGSVLLIDLVKPRDTSCVIFWSGLPIFTAWVRHVSQSDKSSAMGKELSHTVRTSNLCPQVSERHRY